MSLLTIIQNVTGLLSLPQPTTVIGSTDKQVLQLLAIANEAGLELASDYNWQALTEEHAFVTTATQTQPSFVPSDYDRIVPNSIFNRSTRRPITGPLTPQEWQWLQAQPVFSTVFLSFRMRTGAVLMTPTPPAGQTIAFEYVSANWVKAADGVTFKSAYTADNDGTFLSEQLIIQSIRWRYQKAKGFAYEEDKETYEDQRDQVIARDGGSTLLTLSPQPIEINRANLPEGNFGV